MSDHKWIIMETTIKTKRTKNLCKIYTNSKVQKINKIDNLLAKKRCKEIEWF